MAVDDVRVVSEVVDSQLGERHLDGAPTRRHVLEDGEPAVGRGHGHGQHEVVFRHVSIADTDHARPQHLLAAFVHRHVRQLESRQLVVLRYDDHVDWLLQDGPLFRVRHVHVEVVLLRFHPGRVALHVVDAACQEVRQLERRDGRTGVACAQTRGPGSCSR